MKMRRNSESQPSGRTQIHNVRFYNLTPRSIQTMAYNKVWKKLALSRNDGSIEIWDMGHAACLERTIRKTPGNSVEGLAWCAERLFSVGLNGELIEWNLQLQKPLHRQHVTGNAIWCLDINREGTELALGTEEGYINIYDIAENNFQYKNLFDKQEGRVLCCRFDASGDFLVTGSVGAIRIWNTRNGHAINRMNITAKQNKTNPQETIVWSLQVLTDFTIISGDSRGFITIWDGRTASQTDSHQVLNADVLTVAVNEEEDKIFCAGIEPTIRIFARTEIKRDDMLFKKWVKFLQRRVHDHDVKALVCGQDYIYSGGVDGYLGISSATRTQSVIVKHAPFLQNPCITVSQSARLILLRHANHLEIWRLGTANNQQQFSDNNLEAKSSDDCDFLPLIESPRKLLELKSKNEEPIVCSTLSSDGRWLCYSTPKEIRLFKFVSGRDEKHVTQLDRIKDLPEQFTPASHLTFSADSMRLMLVSRDTKQILIFSVLTQESDVDSSITQPLDFIECLETSKYIKDAIKLFSVSICGNYIVAASADRTIAVWSVYKGKHFKHLLNLPRYTSACTALAIHAEQPRLVAAFADGKIFEYDLEEMCFTCSDMDYFVDSMDSHCVSSIVLDPRNPNVFIMQNDTRLFVLEKCAAEDEQGAEPTNKRKSMKKTQKSASNEQQAVASLKLKMQKSYEHLIHLCWLSPEELVAVGVNPITLLEQLPDAFKEKQFRTT